MDFAQFFSQIESAVGDKLKEKVTGRRLMAFHTARLGKNILSGELPVVWANVAVPFEIINAFPVASTYSEFIGAVLAGAQIAGQYIETAEAAGFTTDGCSYHRALLGAHIAGIIPDPIAVISATVPCDGGLKAVSEIGRRANAKNMVLNVPERCTDESVAYLADQLKQMTEFLAEATGTAFDRDKFREIIVKSNEAARLLTEVYAFGEHVPAPYDQKALKNFQIVMIPLMGFDSGIEIAKTFREEFAAAVSQNKPGLVDEKLRLLWIQNRIQFPNDLLETLAEKYGANIVWDELNEIYWEPIDSDDPFTGLAKRLIDSPLGGNLQQRLDVLKTRSVQYKLDGAIHPGHWGCRQSQNARALFAKALKEVDVPMISLDVDCVDSRSFFPGQLSTRLDAFCEMLLENR